MDLPSAARDLQAELDGHIGAGRWSDAAATLVDMAEAAPEPVACAGCLYVAALIFRDRLQDPQRAAALLQAAVDQDPGHQKAWNALDGLGEPALAAETLRACYGRALARLEPAGAAALRARLWAGLGALSWTRLHDRDTALLALEASRVLAPDAAALAAPWRVSRDGLLAELSHELGPDALDRALAAYQGLR